MKALVMAVWLAAAVSIAAQSTQSPQTAPLPRSASPTASRQPAPSTASPQTTPPTSSVDQALLRRPLGDAWPTYSGDYTGKRYSTLTQVNQRNVKQLSLAWTRRLVNGPGPGQRLDGPRLDGPRPPGATPLIVGGVGTLIAGGPTQIKGAVLQAGGVLYVTTPDNTWALDALDGHEIWHYTWKTKGGTHIGNRGVGMWRDALYFVTPDNYLVSLNAKTGQERWHTELASFEQQYFHTIAPVVVDNHVLVGSGNDLDMPGFLQSFDPETGALQWKWYATPQKASDPGLETWKDLDAASHGGGHPWVPGSYDPETRLYIIGTGNPTPAYTSAARGFGDNLFTCALVAIHVDTGKMVWHYQTSPHDTHDWDSAQTPILVDGAFGGRQRKMVLTAARNGYFFVVDRVTGEHLLTSKFSESANWATGLNAKGQPVRDPAKDHHIGGALVSAANQGAANWPPPAFSPDTGLFYVPTADTYAMYYLTEPDPRGALGLGGKDERPVGTAGSYLTAIDYKTGKVVWRRQYRTHLAAGLGTGLLTTAGRLLFAGDVSGNFVAYDPANGTPLWHTQLGQVTTNAPETYLVDGKQHVLVAAGDTLYAFALY
jgi:alcohol dehydrogenase (cytochrome c)